MSGRLFNRQRACDSSGSTSSHSLATLCVPGITVSGVGETREASRVEDSSHRPFGVASGDSFTYARNVSEHIGITASSTPLGRSGSSLRFELPANQSFSFWPDSTVRGSSDPYLSFDSGSSNVQSIAGMTISRERNLQNGNFTYTVQFDASAEARAFQRLFIVTGFDRSGTAHDFYQIDFSKVRTQNPGPVVTPRTMDPQSPPPVGDAAPVPVGLQTPTPEIVIPNPGPSLGILAWLSRGQDPTTPRAIPPREAVVPLAIPPGEPVSPTLPVMPMEPTAPSPPPVPPLTVAPAVTEPTAPPLGSGVTPSRERATRRAGVQSGLPTATSEPQPVASTLGEHLNQFERTLRESGNAILFHQERVHYMTLSREPSGSLLLETSNLVNGVVQRDYMHFIRREGRWLASFDGDPQSEHTPRSASDVATLFGQTGVAATRLSMLGNEGARGSRAECDIGGAEVSHQVDPNRSGSLYTSFRILFDLCNTPDRTPIVQRGSSRVFSIGQGEQCRVTSHSSHRFTVDFLNPDGSVRTMVHAHLVSNPGYPPHLFVAGHSGGSALSSGFVNSSVNDDAWRRLFLSMQSDTPPPR